MPIRSRTVNVDVDVYLEDFEDDELIDELESRGYNVMRDSEDIDPFLKRAHVEMLRGRNAEALIWLEKAILTHDKNVRLTD